MFNKIFDGTKFEKLRATAAQFLFDVFLPRVKFTVNHSRIIYFNKIFAFNVDNVFNRILNKTKSCEYSGNFFSIFFYRGKN